jgi:TonB-dependent receptor
MQSAREPRTSTNSLSGLNLAWDVNDNFSVMTDISFSKAERSGTAGGAKVDMKVAIDTLTYDWRTGNTLPDIAVGNILRSDNQNSFAAYNGWAELGGTEITDSVTDSKITGNWKLDDGILESVLFGVSYTDSKKEHNVYASEFSDAFCCGAPAGVRLAADSPYLWTYGPHQGVGIPDLYLSDTGIDGYLGAESGDFLRNWLAVDLDSIIASWQLIDPNAYEQLKPIYRPGRSFAIEETVTSAFTELNFSGDWGASFDLNLGVRVTKTEQSSQSADQLVDYVFADEGGIPRSLVYTNISSPTEAVHTYTEVLPSANLSVGISENLVLRVSAAKVLSRAPMNDLRLARDIQLRFDNTVNSGNPQLNPFLAYQYDLTLEWYYAETSSIGMNIFYKDIDSFIVQKSNGSETNNYYIQCVCDATEDEAFGDEYFQDITLELRKPSNDDEGGFVGGAEIAWNQDLDMVLPEAMQGFGLIINYTYLDSETEQLDNDNNNLPFIGTSDSSYNAIVYFERDKFGGRVAYNWRDRYLNELGSNATQGDELYVEAIGWLDLQAYYNLNDNVTFTAYASNLANSDFSVTAGANKRFLSTEYTGSQYGAGIRVKF